MIFCHSQFILFQFKVHVREHFRTVVHLSLDKPAITTRLFKDEDTRTSDVH